MKPAVLVLAGGVGRRFYPLTINKTMLPLLGKPLIAHTFDQLAAAKIEQVFVAANPFNIDFLRNIKIPGCNITVKLQPEAGGMAEAVMLFENDIKGSPLIVMNSIDTLDNSLMTDMLTIAKSHYAAVAGYEMTNYFPGGYINIKGDRAISLIEKPGEKNRPSNIVKLVLDFYSKPKDLIDQIKLSTGEADSVYEEALNRLIQQQSVYAYKYKGYWQPLKHSYQILSVMDIYLRKRLKNQISRTSYIAKSAFVDENVFIDDGAKIFNNASVKGPAYIGRGAVVGDNALVRESVVEEGAVVGFGSEVTRSYIGPKCMLHHNFVGDSVLESRVNPSYGTCFTNMRFDKKTIKITDKDGNYIDTGRDKFGAVIGDNAFLGANSTILPGRVIGPNKNCMPGSVISKNVF